MKVGFQNIYLGRTSSPEFTGAAVICRSDSFEFTKNGVWLEHIAPVTVKRKFLKFSLLPEEAHIYKIDEQKDDKSEEYFLISGGNKILGELLITLSKEAVDINNLEAYGRKTYRGIGSTLLQVAIERSGQIQGKPPITLRARKLHALQARPSTFYEKMGFIKVEQPKEDEDKYGIAMELHPYQYDRWVEKVEKSPIFSHKLLAI